MNEPYIEYSIAYQHYVIYRKLSNLRTEKIYKHQNKELVYSMLEEIKRRDVQYGEGYESGFNKQNIS